MLSWLYLYIAMKSPLTIKPFLFTLGIICSAPFCGYTQNIQHYAAGFSNISFQHLTTANGLSYSGIRDLCIDKSGSLWIATGNGLNMFNGRAVTKYYAADYPELVSNSLLALSCDENNRIWVLTAERTVLMIDENRKMHKVVLGAGGSYYKTRALISTKNGEPVLFTEKGFSQLKPFSSAKTDSLGDKEFTPVIINGFDSLQAKKFKHVFKFDDDRYFFSQDTVMFVVNFKTKRVEHTTTIPVETCLQNGAMKMY